MATYGQPLEMRHGVGLYSAQTTQGTPVTPATTIGPATFGHTKRSNNKSFRGPGSPNRYAVKGGMTLTEWEMQWEGITSGIKTLLTKAVRASNVVPWLTLGFGVKDDAGSPTRTADQIQDCKTGQFSLDFSAGTDHNPLSGSMSGIGGLVTILTSLNPSVDTSTPYMGYECIALLNGVAQEMEAFSISVNHNLQPRTVIRGAAAASFPRGPAYFVEGDEEITGSITLFSRNGINPFANCPSAADDFSFVFTNLCDATTLTLALTDLSYDNEAFQVGTDGARWKVDYEATSWSLS